MSVVQGQLSRSRLQAEPPLNLNPAPLDVQVTLRCADTLDDFDTRVFTLRPGASPGAHPPASVPLGRSSKNSTKPELMIGANNAYIDAPTISREHAVLTATSPSAPIVTIMDNGSMHGTTVNGVKLEAKKPRRLHDGDELTFGADILRDQRTAPTFCFLDAEADIYPEHFTARKFVFESSIVTDSYSFAVPDDAISSDDEEDIEIDEAKSTPPAWGAALNPVELEETHHAAPHNSSSQDIDEFGDEDLFVGEDEFMLQVDSDNLDTTLGDMLEERDERGSLAISPSGAVSYPILSGTGPRPVISSFGQDAYSDNDGSWGGPLVSTSFTNDESYSDDDVSIDYPSDDGALTGTHSFGDESESDMESGDDGSSDSGDLRSEGYESEQEDTESVKAMDLVDPVSSGVGIGHVEDPASSPTQPRTWDTSPLPLRELQYLPSSNDLQNTNSRPASNVYHAVPAPIAEASSETLNLSPHAVPAPITEASSETVGRSSDGSYHMSAAVFSTPATSLLTPVSEASTAKFWSTISAGSYSKESAPQTSPSEVASPCPLPVKRTKVSIPEIIEETFQQPEQTQKPELAAEMADTTRGTKRKADIFEEEVKEPETQLVLDASSEDAHGVATGTREASPEIIAQRPRKRLRRRLGGMVKTAAAWMVPGVVGAAGAVAFLTSVPNDFFVP